MSVFRIKSKHLTHIPQMDEEHGQLFEIADMVRRELLHPGKLEAARQLFGVLQDHLRIHFANEERVMRQCDYPGYYAHKQAHQNVLAEVEEMHRQLAEGRTTSMKQFNTSIAIWLASHITTEDAKLGKYLLERGAKRQAAAGALPV